MKHSAWLLLLCLPPGPNSAVRPGQGGALPSTRTNAPAKRGSCPVMRQIRHLPPRGGGRQGTFGPPDEQGWRAGAPTTDIMRE